VRVFRRFGEVRLSDDIDGFMKLVGDELMCGENTTTGEVFTLRSYSNRRATAYDSRRQPVSPKG
jgi:hypothetical protein